MTGLLHAPAPNKSHGDSPALKVRKFEKVCETLHKHGYNSNRLIPILQEVQEEYRYLPEEVLTYVATALNLSPARVYGVATFYAHFALEPKGKHLIRMCDGTACHVKNSEAILSALKERLGLHHGRKTTDDMLFTLETVSCLGACGIAPVVVINEEVHGQMNPQSALALVDEIFRKEEGTDEL